MGILQIRSISIVIYFFSSIHSHRINSTILGQRKPKEVKRKKKKRQNRRCNSEGDASDYEPTVCGIQQKQQKSDTITCDQNKQIKNNLIFDIEI